MKVMVIAPDPLHIHHDGGRVSSRRKPSAGRTQNLVPGCPPISTPPGPTGYVKHIQFGEPNNYWLGCYVDAMGQPMGIDSELDGKVNNPPAGFSVCMQNPTDCVELFEGGFDQDECYADGSDAGIRVKATFLVCRPVTIPFEVFNCGTVREIYLNVLVDWNKDGDWNDNFACPSVCVYEWAVKNTTLTLMPGCNFLTTPPIIGGPMMGMDLWMRITISDAPVTDDFPWAGSLTPTGDELSGGETEDYQVDLMDPTPAEPRTWGGIKSLYR